MNGIFICQDCFQISELFHIFKGFIIYRYIAIFRAWFSRDIIYLVFSAFSFRSFTLIATTKASVFYFIVCMLPTKHTGCFKLSFTNLKAYRNLYRRHTQRFELSKCSKTHRVLPRIVIRNCFDLFF
jgi:hypothetical protein